tara:strand:- start:36310 stop:37701 length:1392 start_codon:yes stop_codon:yes gene_type:complete
MLAYKYINKLIKNKIIILIVVILLIRAFLNYSIPLMDKTEARYAEIARIMNETKNWITPQIDYGVPFWGKPPISSWMSAITIFLFGENEFFLRLPYFFLSIILFFLTLKHSEPNNKLITGLVLITLPQFFLHLGVVSTDLFLTFGVSLAFLSFWKFSNKKNRSSIYFFFTGLAIGVLSKGPIAIILVIPPILLWMFWFSYDLKNILIKDFLYGLIFFMSISLPWFFIAEKNSPGFLDYFIVGEHFKRFFDSNWIGDKYGFPKQQPIGTIWVFLFLFTMPWGIIIIKKLLKEFKKILKNKWEFYLILWIIWTPIFFTTSSSLIHPYVLPVMPAIALLVGILWNNVKYKNIYTIFSSGIIITVFILYIFGFQKKIFLNNTDKYLIEKVDSDKPLFSLNEKSYSSQFYSKGSIEVLDIDQFQSLSKTKSDFFIIINNKDFEELENTKNLYLIEKNEKKGLYRTFIN